MSARIDHAGWANGFITDALAPFDPNEPEIDGDVRDTATPAENLAFAQVHATLALVEQQRIANLIAIMTNAARQVGEGTASGPDFAALYSKLNPLIEEALGLS